MSRLRARCPSCRTLTAVAVGPEYECHSCGRVFGAGLVRVPRAWGSGGEAMAEAARLPLDYPEAATVEEESLAEQSLVIASVLPERPLVLGGCCCAHIGAVQGLAMRLGRVGVVWIDAHGDLNTPSSSPSGNEWGMPLRMLIDGGTLDARDVVLVGARNLDPPEEQFVAETDLALGAAGLARAVEGTGAVYVAFDADSLDPGEGLAVFMPEPAGLTLADAEALLRRIVTLGPVAGAGFTGLIAHERNVALLDRLCSALGLDRGGGGIPVSGRP